MSEAKIILTPAQAKSLLARRKEIHTFRSGPGMLIGADWRKDSIIDAIDKAKIVEVGGEQCKRMGHGLVVWTGNDPLFVEVDSAKLEKLEAKITKKS